MIDEKKLKEEIEKRALIKARGLKRILAEYKPLYDQMYYTTVSLSRFQRAKIYNLAYKFLKKDIKQLKRVEKKIRKDEKKEK